MSKGWIESKREADKYLPEIERIVRSIAGKIIEFIESTPEEDQKFATDYKITVTAGDIACRVREQYYWCNHGDFTLRNLRPSGNVTEVEKIKEGHARWYLYAWTERFTDHRFIAWMFVDLDKLRQSNLLDIPRTPIWNHDNSSNFIAISLLELQSHDCITAQNQAVLERLTKLHTAILMTDG